MKPALSRVGLAIVVVLALTLPVMGQTGGAPTQSSNVLNPNISVVGEIVGSAGNDESLPDGGWELSEVELAIQSPIDSYARADLFLGFHEEGVEIEEGYLTWLAMPAGFQLKLGKFLANAGKFNTIHGPETPFADRPLAAERFFGDHGLAGIGASLSWLAPTSFFLELDLEVTSNWEEAPAFGLFVEEEDEDHDDHGRFFRSGEHEDEHGHAAIEAGGERSDLGYLLRAETYADLSEAANLTLGLSALSGPVDPEGHHRNLVAMADATFRWRPPERSIYRSFLWQTEFYWSDRDEAEEVLAEDADGGQALGLMSYFDWQVARRWHVGLRADWTETPDGARGDETGALAFVTFNPSEFSSISLQGRVVENDLDERAYAAFLRVTFSLGPHGVHSF